MEWQDFFKIVYHPAPERYYIHWLSNSQPIGDPFIELFWSRKTAEQWINNNYNSILNSLFEKDILGG